MKSSKKLQILSHLLFVYIDHQDRKWRMAVLVFSSALISPLLFGPDPPKPYRGSLSSPLPAAEIKSEIFTKFQKNFSITSAKLFQNVSRIFILETLEKYL